MSRHVYSDKDYGFVVGWDAPMGTFYAQVYLTHGAPDWEEQVVNPYRWFGTYRLAIPTIEILNYLLDKNGLGNVPEGIGLKLREDCEREGYNPPAKPILRLLNALEDV